jgi:hypothetical protein|tara:strand:+ start:1942 stop:2139 length:198 start_codon:yes stop_codon:yes gene_type:complete
MYLLIIYNNPVTQRICALYKFACIKDIIRWSGNIINYSDASKKNRKYRTYKSFFKVVKIINKIKV